MKFVIIKIEWHKYYKKSLTLLRFCVHFLDVSILYNFGYYIHHSLINIWNHPLNAICLLMNVYFKLLMKMNKSMSKDFTRNATDMYIYIFYIPKWYELCHI